MFKKLSLKALLIIYSNLVIITLIFILIVFINRGVDPKDDPNLINSYVKDTRIVLEPIIAEYNRIWTMAELVRKSFILKEFVSIYKKKMSKQEKDRLEDGYSTLSESVKATHVGEVKMLESISFALKNWSIPISARFDPKSNEVKEERDSEAPENLKKLFAFWEKDLDMSQKGNIFIRFSPQDIGLSYVFFPIFTKDNEFFGRVIITARIKDSMKALFYPVKSDEKESFFLFNYNGLLAEKDLRFIHISGYFPELPKDFLSQEGPFFWDKNDNLFVKASFSMHFEGNKAAYLVQRIPKKVIDAPLNLFKRKLITLSIILLIIISILDFFVISKGIGPLKKAISDLDGTTKILGSSSAVLNTSSTEWAESSLEMASGIENIMISMEGFLKTFGEIKNSTDKAEELSKGGSQLANSVKNEAEKLLVSITEINQASKKNR